MNSKLFQSAYLSLLIVIVTYALQWGGVLSVFENRLWDLRVTYLSQPSEHDPSIKLILIDQSSLDWAEENHHLSWPWPREIYSALIAHAKEGGAKAVIFDMLFTEPSFYAQEDDRRFALSLEQTPTIGALVLSNTQGDKRSWPKELIRPIYQHTSEGTNRFSRAAFPTDTIASSFRALGSVVSTPDEDGIIRKTDLLQTFDSRNIPSLALSSYLTTHPHATYRLDDRSLKLHNHTIDLTEAHKAIINYHGPSQTYTTYNAASVIESRIMEEQARKGPIPSDLFKESYVIIGLSAPGLMDLKSTPTQNIYPGAEIHATVLDNLIHNDFISEAPIGMSYLALGILIFITLSGIRLHSSLQKGSIYPIIALSIAIAGSIFAYHFHLWLNLTLFITGIILAWILGFGINYFREGAQKRFIKNAFSRYISPQLIDSLIQHPENLKLGGRRETLSILFSDIEGFTTISTRMEPEVLARFLNEYLGLMSDCIMNLGGTIDKYEGDAIIAFWNAPLPQEDHPLLALKAAMECQKLLAQYNPHFLERYGHQIKTRFGIHTGEVIIGNLGTEKRFDYTFIGDAGNLASRLESANKQFSTYVMISEQTKTLLHDDYHFRELGMIRVVGRTESVRVFEPLSTYDHEVLSDYHNALHLFYRGKLDEAAQAFQELASVDPVSRAYLNIIAKIRSQTMGFHEGVITLEEK